MKFSTYLARRIIQQNGLEADRFLTWQRADEIPERYFNNIYTRLDPRPPVDEPLKEATLTLARHRLLKLTALPLPDQLVRDVARNHRPYFRLGEVIALHRNLCPLLDQISDYLAGPDAALLATIVGDARINRSRLAGSHRLSERLRRHASITPDDVAAIQRNMGDLQAAWQAFDAQFARLLPPIAP